MPKAYSEDLRKRVVEAADQGMSYRAVAKKFDIAANTVNNWHTRYQKEGHYKEKPRLGKKPRLTRAEFEDYVDNNPDQTLKEIGRHFGMTGRSARYYMDKFAYKYKKKSRGIMRQARRNKSVI